MIYRNEYLTDVHLAGLDAARDRFLGPASDMTSKPPIPDPDNSKGDWEELPLKDVVSILLKMAVGAILSP